MGDDHVERSEEPTDDLDTGEVPVVDGEHATVAPVKVAMATELSCTSWSQRSAVGAGCGWLFGVSRLGFPPPE